MSIIKRNDYSLSGDYENESNIQSKDSKIIKSSLLSPLEETIVVGDSMSSSSNQDFSSPSSSDSFFDDTSDFSSSFDDHSFDSPSPTDQPQVEQQQPVNTMAEIQPYMDDLANAINGLKAARDQVIQSAESGLVNLALDVAAKVINKAVEMDQSIIKGVVEDTFNKISGSDRVTFKINPADMETFTSFQNYMENRLVGVDKISIQQDASIDQGGCMIETDLGFVDVTIKEKLNIITQAFKKVQSTL